MRNIIIALILVLVFPPLVSAEPGLINVKSSHNVENTADRLEMVLNEKGRCKMRLKILPKPPRNLKKRKEIRMELSSDLVSIRRACFHPI